jgi:hypothetical protein
MRCKSPGITITITITTGGTTIITTIIGGIIITIIIGGRSRAQHLRTTDSEDDMRLRCQLRVLVSLLPPPPLLVKAQGLALAARNM